jgi:hypothetical protein
MKPRLSRLEGNKEIRRVLNRHQVDLSYCSYSCSGREVRLTGSLFKIDGGEFSSHQIEILIQDFSRHLKGFTLQGDFDNWNFTQDHITSLKTREEKPVYQEIIVNDDQDDVA